MNTIDMIRNFTGTCSEYNRLHKVVKQEQINDIRIHVLSIPSHHRLRVFGKETLSMVDMLHTIRTRRVYA